MDNVDLDVLRQISAWRAEGHAVVMGTIARTWGSAPRPVGSLVAVRGDGHIAGSVSGGCIEDDLMARMREGTLAAHGVELVRYGISGDEAARFGLPCGGTLEVLFEPVGPPSRIDELLAALERGERVRRELQRASGEATLQPALGGDVVQLDEERLVSTFGPHWRLFIVGAGQMSQYLARMAQALDYEVTVCDPREEYAPELPGATLTRAMPDDAVREFAPDAHSAVIALTHDPKLDDLALMEALRSPAFYIGAIGSRTNQARRKERLAEHFGFTEAEMADLRGPVGLKNGARTPPEIAVSILAELTAARYGWQIPEPVFVGRAARGRVNPEHPAAA
ncbi:MAG: XdhC family protein [Burkholderiales bacterium]|nr:XdhC family protein [Burkholderiales bacterium]